MARTHDFNGKWALVTGASAGIGIALARELASCGAKLILTARRKDRLDALAAEFNSKGTETRIVVADLNDSAAAQQIYGATEGSGINVEILVLNTGLGRVRRILFEPGRAGIEPGPRQLRIRHPPVATLCSPHGRASTRMGADPRLNGQLSARALL